jgi:hypothetical protein
MEIYRNEIANIDLMVPVTALTGTFNVTVYSGATLLYTFPTVIAISGGYRVVLPFSLVDADRDLTIKWRFSYLQGSSTLTYAYDTNVSVVTPYLTHDDILTAIPEASALSSLELSRLERKIRGVIDNFTGQSFGKFIGSNEVTGAGDRELKLPDRLLEMTNLTGFDILKDSDGDTELGFYAVRGDGWFIGIARPTPDGDFVFENVIRNPRTMWNNCNHFRDDVVYTVTGTWGYYSVPQSVIEAAIILCEDEICPQSEYRDRYLKTISGDGWRYEYNPAAYSGTGSVVADQLLSQFCVQKMLVI